MSTIAMHSSPERVEQLKDAETLGEAFRFYASERGPRLMMAAAFTALAVRLLLGPFTIAELAVAASVVVIWWLQEWVAHITLLHMRPRRILGLEIDPIYARFHRAHHREPWSADWVFVPARFIVPAFFLSGALAWWVFPTLELAATAWASYCVMGALYEWSHLLVHTRYKPRSRFFREIWRNHRLHHFKNEGYWFGLSGTFVDSAFGTAPDAADVPTSDTVRTLGIVEGES